METGFTFYMIPGLNLDNLPFESDEPLTGPHFAVLIPGQVAYVIDLNAFQVKLLAGGFFFYQVLTRLNEGNLDRALIAYESWDVATSDMDIDVKPGGGLMGGMEVSIPVNDRFSLVLGCQYLVGSSGSALSGTYSGGQVGSMIETRQANFDSAKTLIEGFEISFGVDF